MESKWSQNHKKYVQKHCRKVVKNVMKKRIEQGFRDKQIRECREGECYMGRRVEGHSRAGIAQVSEARIEGYRARNYRLQRDGKRIRV